MNTPVQLATVPADVLRQQQWDLAVLFLQCLNRPLTVTEVQDTVGKLKSVLDSATITWQQ